MREVFKHCTAGDIAIRVFDDNDNCLASHSAALDDPELLEELVASAILAEDANANFCPPPATFLGGRARMQDLAEAPVILVELDKAPEMGRREIESVLGKPTLVVASGGRDEHGAEKLHLYWRLRTPARTSKEFETLYAVRAAACAVAGGDRTGIPPAHPMRWPGSVHAKDPANPRLARIVEESASETTLHAAVKALSAKLGRDITQDATLSSSAGRSLRAPSMEALRTVVRRIPNSDCEWDQWARVGMAVFNAGDGTPEAFEIFREWSARSEKYSEADVTSRWRHWTRGHAADRLGWRTLLSMRVKTEADYERTRERLEARRARQAAASAEEQAEPPVEEEDAGPPPWRHAQLLGDYTRERLDELAHEFGGMAELLMADDDTIREVSDFLDLQSIPDIFAYDLASPPVPAGLPPLVEAVAAAYQQEAGADAGLVVGALLGAFSALHTYGTQLEMHLTDRNRYSTQGNLFIAGIAPPGSNKSLAVKVGERVLAAAQEYLYHVYEVEFEELKQDILLSDDKMDDAKAYKAAKARLPRPPLLHIGSFTPEGLRDVLASEAQRNRPTNVYMDELANLLKTMGGYTKGSNVPAAILEGYEGGRQSPSVRANRSAGGDVISVKNWCFGIVGMMQDTVFEAAQSEYDLVGNGFFQRFLFVLGRKHTVAPTAEGDDLPTMEQQLQIAGTLVALMPPRTYTFGPEALERWRDFHAWAAERASMLEAGNPNDIMAQMLRKSATTVGRLALTLHLMDAGIRLAGGRLGRDVGRHTVEFSDRDMPDHEIPDATVKAAEDLFRRWFLPSFDRAFRRAVVGNVFQGTVQWLAVREAAGEAEITRRDLITRGRSSLRTASKEVQDLVLQELEVAGVLEVEDRFLDGTPRIWTIRKGLGERFAAQVSAYNASMEWREKLKDGSHDETP